MTDQPTEAAREPLFPPLPEPQLHGYIKKPEGTMTALGFTADEMNAHATAAVEADRARAVAAPAGWKIERQPTGELIINGPYVGVVVRENPSELRLIPEEALFMLATDLLAATQATAVAVPDEVAKLAGDFIEHEHPMFGDGYFCTPDVFERIAALALAPSNTLSVLKRLERAA